ncbi:ParB/RepB/Spo0J family partition protein [Saccharothrix sp. MB29]|nr:ParB/RepB/Spo0J family partition protein [Saccharothrix sp. MB29]
MSIADLVLSDSPRIAGEDDEHTRALAESEHEMPPIVVQRGTNRVVDGRHRVHAARLRGEHAIRAWLFDGDDESAFVLAVRLNGRHGLPLTLADRKEAAARILRTHAAWSNRAIASITGLSHKTVAALRAKAGQPGGQARIGRDGRTRPLSTASGRECARKILERDPTSSLRDVSAIAGVSPGTVRDVRDQLLRAERVIPSPRPAIAAASWATGSRQWSGRSKTSRSRAAPSIEATARMLSSRRPDCLSRSDGSVRSTRSTSCGSPGSSRRRLAVS